jgi:hypothetical protein
VTFRFEAEIGTIFPGIPFDSGIDYAVGDVITGQFTFEPAYGLPESLLVVVQPYSAVLKISGFAFQTPNLLRDLTLESFDNAFYEVDCSTLCTGFQNERDTLAVGGSLAPVSSEFLPYISPLRSSFRISLHGDPSILDQALLPLDSATWNEFVIEQQINVSIRGHENGVMGFQATITQFTTIPEPSSTLLGFGLFMCARLIGARRQIFYFTI